MASQVTNGLPSRAKPQKLPSRAGAPKGVNKLNKPPGLGQASGAVNGVAGQATSAAGQAAQNLPIPSAYGIMASRIANRVAEMAENITFVERYVSSVCVFHPNLSLILSFHADSPSPK